MYPQLFGVISSWLLFVVLAVIAALAMFRFLSGPYKLSDKAFKTFGIILIASILIGFVFAWLFQGLYNYIDIGEWNLVYRSNGKLMLGGVTFMGGLVGGCVAFMILSLIFVRGNEYRQLWNMIALAPICVAAAHCLGRIGCFLGGCCYGIVTESFLGMDFGDHQHRLPTQLFEAIFLAILFIIMIVLVLKYKKYNLAVPVYLFSYSVFRFCLEFIRDDYRGGAGALSPSQWQSLIMFAVGIFITVYMFAFKKIPFNGKQKNPSVYIFDSTRRTNQTKQVRK